MGITPHVFDSHDAFSEKLADRIIELVKKKPDAVIGLATGGTPEPVYAHIVAKVAAARAEGHPIDLSRTQFFALDEYVGLPPSHPQSYNYYLWNKLLAPIGAAPNNVHIPNGMAPDIEKECSDYEAALAKAGKVDLWIVGIGHNGHIAFNEPPAALDGRTRVVQVSERTQQANAKYFPDGQVPKQAISVGLGTLKQYAKNVALVANGEGKREILEKMFSAPRVTGELPATLLRTMNTDAYFDMDAAGLERGTEGVKKAAAIRA